MGSNNITLKFRVNAKIMLEQNLFVDNEIQTQVITMWTQCGNVNSVDLSMWDNPRKTSPILMEIAVKLS